jgi:glycosyltransferase involved in cell wall biosynthesis
MRIVHIVSSITSTNFGVWHAAIFGSVYLKEVYEVNSELWICTRTKNDTIEPEIPFNYFSEDQLTRQGVKKWLSQYDCKDTIIVTHGTWLKPTFIGYRAKKSGFRWVYLSQGMFEPWALQNGWLKKKIYFTLFEKRMGNNADIIRAVSKPEERNLHRLFKNKIYLIYNGVKFDTRSLTEKPVDKVIYLFLARLHHKKGILPLVKAWSNSLKQNNSIKLIIVGPDEGELAKIIPYISGNIEYMGPLFGEEKKKMLQKTHYYVLPSFSEGFPSSVVEAMSYGAIPIISQGCNFPEVFEEKLGYQITTDDKSISEILEKVSALPYDNNLSCKNISYVENNLTEKIIGDQLLKMYIGLLEGN